MAISEELQRRISNLTGDIQMGAKGNYKTMYSPQGVQDELSKGNPVYLGDYRQAISNQATPQHMPMTPQRMQERIKNDPRLSELEKEELLAKAQSLLSPKADATPRGFTDIDLQREAEGNALSERDLDLAQSLLSSPNTPPLGVRDKDLRETIEALEMELFKTNDPEEQEIIERMIKNTSIRVNAPYHSLMEQLSQTAGEDDMMAHVRSGDINVSREIVEANPELENLIEKSAIDAGIEPDEMVYGSGGIISLDTGLEQHGFIKKLGKGLKKVVKKVAPVAMLIPGVGTALGAAMGGLGSLAGSALTKVGLGGVASSLGGLGSAAMKGIAGLNIPGISSIAGGASAPGAAFQALKAGGLRGAFAGGPLGGMMSQTPELTPVSNTMDGPVTGYMDADGNMYTPQEAAALQQAPNFFGGGEKSLYGNFGTQPMLDANGQPIVNAQGQPINAQGQPITQTQQRGGSSIFGGGGGGMGGLGGLATLGVAGGLAGALGKLAYEETKKDKGVSLSPVMAMDATGRYNLQAEVARQMGQQAPNPAEFGLLPAGTFPELSGGKPREVMAAAGGGAVYPMAYAEGGTVSMEDFERKQGGINGVGSETSDDVPAMLSDGEFVMTGQAVRGAGSYEMQADNGGILTLIPSLDEDRERGTDLMYTMMEVFGNRANAS